MESQNSQVEGTSRTIWSNLSRHSMTQTGSPSTLSSPILTASSAGESPLPWRDYSSDKGLVRGSYNARPVPVLPLNIKPVMEQAGSVPGTLVLRSSARPLSPACFGTVRRAARCCGLREVGENEEWTVYWTDNSVSLERVMEMKRFQPFLIDGFKFDMRIYVLVTSCDPLRIFAYNEGLVRFATMRYIDPSSRKLDDICMHLTNYAINKRNENFIQHDTMGSKSILNLDPCSIPNVVPRGVGSEQPAVQMAALLLPEGRTPMGGVWRGWLELGAAS
uniref:Uncharacterized protein n=1 Tax=Strigops habroptila TaxID=2489341 RepID=A0A672U2H8_STRHB